MARRTLKKNHTWFYWVSIGIVLIIVFKLLDNYTYIAAWFDMARISRRYHVAEGHRDADPPHARGRREGGRAAADCRSVLPAKGLTAEILPAPTKPVSVFPAQGRVFLV